jgi:hypothetical protein
MGYGGTILIPRSPHGDFQLNIKVKIVESKIQMGQRLEMHLLSVICLLMKECLSVVLVLPSDTL